MPGKSITFLYKFAMEHEIGIVTYEDENIITETPENEYVLEEQKINKMTIKKVDSFCDYVKFPVTKCLMVGDGDILENIETKLKEEVGQMLSIYRSAPYFLEIMPLNITKDGALSWYATLTKSLHLPGNTPQPSLPRHPPDHQHNEILLSYFFHLPSNKNTQCHMPSVLSIEQIL